jgi:N-acetylgalactosamine 4-sulfate 6-O-sulfotransferase
MRVAVVALLLSTAAAVVSAIDPVSYLKAIKTRSKTHNVSEIWKDFKPSLKAEKIMATSPDIWKVLPSELDSKYRNPCWTDKATNRFRCAPFFQIIGVSKCGTTDLFARLKKHPELADGSKGPHWWDECPHPPRGACTAPPNGDFDGYVNLFEKGAYQIKTNPLMITGEASSNTFTGVFTFVRGLAVRRKIEDVNLAELIHEAQPYQKLIVIVREPVSRYYSAFHYYRRSSKAPFESPERFHEKAVEDIKRWKACVEKSGVPACLKRYDPQQLIKGMYSEFVEAWKVRQGSRLC